MIIFDLDGTLLNTLDDLHNALNYALNSHSFPKKTLTETKKLLGNGAEILIANAINSDKNNPKSKEVYQTFKKYYTSHINDHTKPYDGIISLLKELKTRQIKTAIVSNKFDEGVKILTKRYFNNLIDYAQGTSDLIPKKPSPNAILAVIKILQAENEKNIYIGDSEIDIMTAQNANIPCISVSWGFRNKKQLKAAHAEIIIDTPQDLLEILP